MWKYYTIGKVLLTTKQINFIDKKKFAKAVLNKESKTFMIYVAALQTLLIGITICFS